MFDDNGVYNEKKTNGTSGSINNIASKKLNFRGFYQRIRNKVVVDPLALLALVIALIPLSISSYYNIFSEGLTLLPIEDATFYSETFLIQKDSTQEILRVALPLQFQNLHPKKTATINKIEIDLNVGKSVQASYYSEDIIHSQRDITNPSKLSFTYLKDATAFSIPPSGVETMEVTFSPKQGEPSDPLSYAITKDNFIRLLEQGEKLTINITVFGNNEILKYRITPKASLRVAHYMNLKSWTVQEMLSIIN